MNDGFYVYRFLNFDNKVLYVGRTHNLKKRFMQHSHLTDQVMKIEYITCDTEIEMIIKELYYINLFHNELSTNVKDVYDKPKNFSFDDTWKLYEDLPDMNDYKKIYVIRLSFYDMYIDFPSDCYFTGKYNEDGLPETTENPMKAKRYSNIKNIKNVALKIHNIFEKINEEIKYENFNGKTDRFPVIVNIFPEIFMSNVINSFLYNYYHTVNGDKSKQLYFEDISLNSKQNDIFTNYISIDGKIIGNVQHDKTWEELEKQRHKLRKDKDWKDPIWDEEFACYYIKNNCDLNKALEELIRNRKKRIKIKEKIELMPLGYRDPGTPLNQFYDKFNFDNI